MIEGKNSIPKKAQTVIGVFSGIGLLDMGFEAAGHCVIRGPDLLWSSDITRWSALPLRGKVNGVLGGVPCQHFSQAVKRENRDKHPDLWRDFWQVVDESQPDWALAECVWGAEASAVNMFDCPKGYCLRSERIHFSRLGSAQHRPRLITYASKQPDGFWKLLFERGLEWGKEWRKLIGRDSGTKYRTIIGIGMTVNTKYGPKYGTVTGDSLQQKQTDKPSRYVKGDDLLDAFDLPSNWKLPDHARISRGSTARLITQGVPVAAAYALGMAVRLAREQIGK